MKPEQITAWALDEASTEERQQLEATLLENPNDKQKADETKAFCDFLLTELRDDSLALTDKQRERLVAQASSAAPSPAAPASPLHPVSGVPPLQAPAPRTTRWNIGVIVRLSLAACAVLGGFWTWQAYSSKQSQARAVAAVASVAEKPAIKVQLASKPEPKKKAGQGPEALLAATPVKPVIVAELPAAKPLSPLPKTEPAAATPALALTKDQRAMSPGDVTRLKQIQDENAYGLSFGGKPLAGLPPPATQTAPPQGLAVPAAGSLVQAGTGVTTQKMEQSAAGGSLVLTGSGVLTSADNSMVQQRPDMMARNGGGAMIVADVDFASPARSLPVSPRADANSPGLISFATAANSQLNASLNSGSISAADQRLLGGLLPTDQHLSGYPASLADSFRLNEMQAAVFKAYEQKEGVDLMGAPRVTTKSGTRATLVVTREFVYPVEFMDAGGFTPRPSSFKFEKESASSMRYAHAAPDASAAQPGMLPGAGTMIASGSMAVPADAGALIVNGNGVAASPPAAMGTSVLTGEVTMISGQPYAVVAPAKPRQLTTTGGIRAYMAANRFVVGDTTLAASNDAVGGTNSLTVGSVVSGAPFERRYGATLDLGGASNYTGGSTYSGGVTVNSGFNSQGSAAPAPPVAVTFASSAPAAPREGETLGATVSGSGALTKTGAGTLTQGDFNSYSGGTTINGGTLSVTNGAKTQSADAFSDTDSSPTKGNPFQNPSLAATVSSDSVAGSASFGGSFSGNLGSLSSNGGVNHIAMPSGDLGMNDIIQLTQGVNTNLGPLSHLDLNGAAQIADAAGIVVIAAPSTLKRSGGVSLNTSGGTFANAMPAAAPASVLVAGSRGLAVKDGKNIGSLGTIAAPVQNPQAVAVDAIVSFPTATPQAGAAGKVQSGLMMGNKAAETGNYDAAIAQYQNVLRTDPYNQAARRGMEAADKKRLEYFKTAYDNQRSKMLAQVTETWEDKVPVTQAGSVFTNTDARTDDFYFGKTAMPEEPKPAPQMKANSGESYTSIIENEMKDVAREPLSTLSIDVDTASYANVRRFLNQNMIPPPDAVRIEELVNYFPTSEEGPAHDAKEPFGVRVELAPCPWQPVHRLARIAIKGREMDKDRKASNLVFLVDVSGSMNEQAKLPLVQQSLRMLTEQLGEGDRVTMVVYAGSSGVVLPPTGGDKKEEILAAINRLSAGGSTHGSAGIKLAYEQAVAGFIKGGVNRVILCTDGDFNVGTSSPEELEKLIKHKAKTGVFLSVLGFGSGNLKDRTMETLADKGNGNYAYIDSLSEARKVLVEQMSGTLVTIAKDVKIQVEFNPTAVRSYRLIGYENRLLAKEDFNDDTKDAGEIGAGHCVVALYEIVPANLPPGAEPRPLVDDLKYQAAAISPAQLAAAAKTGEMMTVKLRYKEPESDLSKLIEMPTKDEGKTLTASSDEFKFSAAVAGFGLLLRDSSYKGSLSWETVRRLALDGKGTDKQGYRGEFLQLIDKARGLKETQ